MLVYKAKIMTINYEKAIKIVLVMAMLTTLLAVNAGAQSNVRSADVYNRIQSASVQLQEKLQLFGIPEATGTHFELNNSHYLNITVDSSEPINLSLESVPEMVTMSIESASGATSTKINLSGFLPFTQYHKYEDNYHNHVAFTTDANGNYTYMQDISRRHIVFIEPRPSTIFINDNATGGDCDLIGTWNPVTRTCKLNTDVTETIEIDNDSIILDGDGHTSTGNGTGSGIYLPERTGVTVKNMNVINFTFGIFLENSTRNNVTDNYASNNSGGIVLELSDDNTVSDNYASNNSDGWGGSIILEFSNNNTLSGNYALNNSGVGIGLFLSNNNTISDNNASNNLVGIFLQESGYNTLNDNNASNNNAFFEGAGFFLESSDNNTLIGNNASNNGAGYEGEGAGFILYYSANNTLSDNYALNNTIGMILGDSTNNMLSGNYVSDNLAGIIVFVPGFEAVLLVGGLAAACYIRRGKR